MVHKAYKVPPKWAPASDGKSRARPMFTGLLNGLLVLDPARVCRSRESVLLGQRKFDNKVDFLLICVSEKKPFQYEKIGNIVWLVAIRSNIYAMHNIPPGGSVT